jgi:protocatechuate 3,4-dioxygenase beta subunit
MKIASISGVVACLVLSSSTVALAVGARAGSSPQSQSTTPVLPSASRPVPARDAERKDVKGTAVLKGRVVAGDSGRPLRRARVTIRAPELGTESQRTTSTNLDGRYEFKDLPAARYRVTVARSGYLGLEHGQRRPAEIGRPVQLADGQTVEGIDFAMPRMGVIAGRVTDESGDPIEGVRIFATRLMFFEGQRKLVPIGTSSNQTDDEGEYRITRLAPGHYYVMATTKEMWSLTENGQERQVGFMPTYFPGVTASSEARRLTIAPGQQIGAIDFALVPGRSAKVSGIAVDSAGRPFSRVSMSEEVRGLGFASFGAGPGGAVAADGTFSIANVPPGEYTISASRREGDPAGPPEVAIATIFVEGSDIENLHLTGSAGGTVRGRIIVEGETPPKMSAVLVSIRQPLRNQPSPVVLGLQRSNREPGAKEDGTFIAENVFGKSRFQVTVPEGWMVKSITHDGKDISDATIELGSGQEMSDVQVVITSRVTSVEGQLKDDKNLPVRDATVLVFHADAEKWFESSRRVRATRPDQDGQWRLKGMPAGEYLAIALDYVEDGAWNDPEYLESLKRDASSVTLAEGAVATATLKVVTPKQ